MNVVNLLAQKNASFPVGVAITEEEEKLAHDTQEMWMGRMNNETVEEVFLDYADRMFFNRIFMQTNIKTSLFSFSYSH